MATMHSSVQLTDLMTSPLMRITSALNMTISSFEHFERTANTSFDGTAFDSARESINQAEIEMQQMINKTTQLGQKQDTYNRKVVEGTGSVNSLASKLVGMVGAYAAFQAGMKVLNLSDQMSQSTAKLNLMNDGMQSTKELQDQIYASAERSRSSYLATTTTVARLGQNAKDAFSNNQETIQFAENLNKMFKISGASQEEQASATLQLTQALSSGVLRGEELNAVFEASPNAIQTIADYMGKPIGKIREMAKDGKITSDIVKNAMLSATDKINKQFESIPMTWNDVWQSMKNFAVKSFEPILVKLNKLANSDKFNQIVESVKNNLIVISQIVVGIFDVVGSVAGFIYDNWSIISPLIMGVAVVMGIYTAALVANNVVLAVSNGLNAIAALRASVLATAQAYAAGATFAEMVAVQGLNAALLACPLVWIILAIVALIAIFYGAIAAVNKFAGTSLSATGMIVGAFFAMGAAIANVFLGLYNYGVSIGNNLYNFIASFANFFANVFNDPVGAIITLFADMLDYILGIIQSAAKLIDTVLKSDLSSSVEGLRTQLTVGVSKVVGEQKVVMKKKDLNTNTVSGIDYGDAYKKGYSIGKGIESKVSGFFKAASSTSKNNENADTSSKLGKIADNTKKTADAVDISKEDLKYLRDISERQAINRFTTAQVNVSMPVSAKINSNVDLDGVVHHVTSNVKSALEQAAEGVHK